MSECCHPQTQPPPSDRRRRKSRCSGGSASGSSSSSSGEEEAERGAHEATILLLAEPPLLLGDARNFVRDALLGLPPQLCSQELEQSAGGILVWTVPSIEGAEKAQKSILDLVTRDYDVRCKAMTRAPCGASALFFGILQSFTRRVTSEGNHGHIDASEELMRWLCEPEDKHCGSSSSSSSSSSHCSSPRGETPASWKPGTHNPCCEESKSSSSSEACDLDSDVASSCKGGHRHRHRQPCALFFRPGARAGRQYIQPRFCCMQHYPCTNPLCVRKPCP